MHYKHIRSGVFLSRPNRFIAHVEIGGAEEVCHVKNTGRCKELLVPGTRVWLEESENPSRKTKYDLVAVDKLREGQPPLLINMDSQAPNAVFGEWAGAHLRPDLTLLRPETRFGNSRFDFYWESTASRGFVEIKGVTLEQDGIVRFPDAPTQRGVKHIEELIEAGKAGYEAALCFIVQMEGMKWVEPNDDTHPAFGAALRKAAASGVEVMALECAVTPDSLTVLRPIPVHL